MYAKICSGTLQGIQADKITVESDVSFGFPTFTIVGLPDAAIRESKERVRAAITNSGFKFPDKRVTVNLSPADIKKEGTHFDLAIAVGILVSCGAVPSDMYEEFAFLGELTLDGKVNRIRGALPLIAGLKEKGVKKIILPEGNLNESGLVEGAEIYPAVSLAEVISFVSGNTEIKKVVFDPENMPVREAEYEDFSDVIGHDSAKRVLQIAAAAMHNVLFTGPPGSGKTMLARRLPGIMPRLTTEERLEITKIYSVYGFLDENMQVVTERPFRSPDHTISPTALVGGGSRIKAGEVSLAHLGVLFLDEFTEFSRGTIEALRRPMEDEFCIISRLSGTVKLPSKFLTVAAMNPCPCGYYGDKRTMCTCSPGKIARYRARLSGPILDRIDMTVNITVPEFDEISRRGRGVSSSELREGVVNARAMQQERYKNEKIRYNSQMRSEHIGKYCRLDSVAEELLNSAFSRMNLSLRSWDKILKVARTIADIEESSDISSAHIAEAISYKCEKTIFK